MRKNQCNFLTIITLALLNGFKPEKVEFDIESDNKNGVSSSILDKYKNHPSIVEIHKNRNLLSNSISVPSSSQGSKVTSKEIKTILKSPNFKKATGIDKIPTKTVKLASEISAKPLPIAINNSFKVSTFPNNPKITSVVPIGKKTDDKYVISSSRPVSILNCFSKLYQNVIKNELLNPMNVHLSPFISANRKNYISTYLVKASGRMTITQYFTYIPTSRIVNSVFVLIVY